METPVERLPPTSDPAGYQLMGFAVFAVLLRLPFFDSPTVHIDEQFYLAVADKWVHHGLLPFVNIWDRKPIGIFVLYALPAAIAKNGILAYQLMASAFVVATGLVTHRIGRFYFDDVTALSAALIYATATVLMEGAGGQTPIFYNIFVALAALILLRATSGKDADDAILSALLASGLFGIALQIKYICAVEAAALSVFFLAHARVYRGWSIRKVLIVALGMIFLGSLPTAIVGVLYSGLGHLPEFIQANFVSIFAKRLWHLEFGEYFRRFVESSLFCIFFLPLGGIGLAATIRTPSQYRWQRLGIALWLISTLPGALALGNPTRHYFLPTLVPLSLLTAYGLRELCIKLSCNRKRYVALAAILLVPVIGCLVIAVENPRERGEATDVRAVGSFIRAHTPAGACPFVFNRLPILYYLADVCAPSIYLFPNHLSEIAEVQTPGGARLAELRRVLEERPPLIYVRRPYSSDIDLEAIAMLESTLEQNYDLGYERRANRQFHTVYVAKRSSPRGQ